MKRRRAVLLLLASFPVAAQQRPPKRPSSQMEILEAKAERTEGKITLDGRVMNSGSRPLSKPVLVFELLDADRKTISRRKGPIDEKVLPLGAEASFHFFIPDHARAVEVMILVEHSGGLEAEVLQPGPYPID